MQKRYFPVPIMTMAELLPTVYIPVMTMAELLPDDLSSCLDEFTLVADSWLD